jgi:radical SAM family RiPP maturation amino acid epimerase
MTSYNLLDEYTLEERSLLAQLKRFFEWVQGDPEFAKNIEAGRVSADELIRMKMIGIRFDLKDISLLWEEPQIVLKINSYYSTINFKARLEPIILKRLNAFPGLKLWYDFSRRWGRQHLNQRRKSLSIRKSPLFNAWWLRRIASVENELGIYGYFLSHSTMAFELTAGCSRRCPFCAYAPEPLRAVMGYSEGGALFKDLIAISIDLFGEKSVGESILYYATEPHDNPSYLNYLEEFTAVTGVYPCTSTAVVKDRRWLEELIAFYKRGDAPYPRLSVLSKADLFFLHENFSPEELFPLHMSMMMKESMEEKVKCGLIFEERRGMKDLYPGASISLPRIPQGSISCVSGFLVNIVDRTMKLVSPCYGSEKWPLGYRVFDEATFESNGQSFRACLLRMIEKNMFLSPPGNKVLRYRDDFDYRETVEGFDLVSYNQVLHFSGGPDEMLIGSMIHKGLYTYNDMIEMANDNTIQNVFMLPSFVGELFNGGVLNEIYE